MTTGNWLAFVFLLLFCFPLCWLPFLAQGEFRICPVCSVDIDEQVGLLRREQRRAEREAYKSTEPQFSQFFTRDNIIRISGAAIGLIALIGIITYYKTAEQSTQNQNTTVSNNQRSSTAYASFKYSSTYNDAVRLMGVPDKDVSTGKPQAKIPNSMIYYKSCDCVLFFVYDKYPDKNTTHYLGTKVLNPEMVIHVSDEKYRTIINAYKFHD